MNTVVGLLFRSGPGLWRRGSLYGGSFRAAFQRHQLAQSLYPQRSSEKLAIVHSQVNGLKHTPRGLHDQRTVTYAIALAAVGELLELIEASVGKP